MNMKLFVLPLVALMMGIANVNAQTAKDVFDREQKIVFLGVDFTKARIIGDAGADADKIVEAHFPGINQKIVNEAKKFDVADAFNRSEVSTDISLVNKRNSKIDPSDLKSDNSDDYQALKPENIATLVKGFDFNGKTGIGLIFFMEGLNKTTKQTSCYVTLVDMKGKKVLFTERVTGSLGMSFGYTNYWLTGIKSIIDKIEKSKYKEWKDQYGK